ncbi:hypothetical protein [Acidovorax sp. CCYZU-2555]|uniref:hypothetical protein n=1 Tax=Acidovorax sp. CCYZU-2555 TaxID=2835042 RepID=UPI001BCC9FE8|nr:hypothetical protein [Acidovorax sp. CCYZU-2555]MBS7778879.1 hypothetical protein [Acidovorax sp. CCYZU-2555]
MLIFRALVGFLFVAALLCFAFYLGTGQAGYKRWAMLILKWTVIAALAFFGVLILGRIA